MNKDNQTRIDMYLRGEMSPADRKTFEHDLKVDASLQQDFDLTRHIVGAIKKRRAMIDDMKMWDEQINNENKKPKASWWKWTAGIGVAAAVCVAAIFIFDKNDEGGTRLESQLINDSAINYLAQEEAESKREKSANTAIPNLQSEDESPAPSMALPPQIEEEEAVLLEMINDENQVAEAEANERHAPSAVNNDNVDSVMYEFTWKRIKVLLESETYSQMLDILKDYRKINGVHKEEAEKIWEKYHKE